MMQTGDFWLTIAIETRGRFELATLIIAPRSAWPKSYRPSPTFFEASPEPNPRVMVTSRPPLAQNPSFCAAYMNATSPSGIHGKVRVIESAAFALKLRNTGWEAAAAAKP